MWVAGVEKESQSNNMHEKALRKSECFAGETGESLSQCEIEAFDVVGLPLLVETGFMLLLVEHLLVGLQQIAVTKSLLVLLGHLRPHYRAGGGNSVSPHLGDYLACSPT